MLILKKLDDMDEMKVAKDIRINTGYEEKLQRGGFTLTLGKCKATVAILRELLGLIRAAKVVDKQFSSQGLAMSSQARLNMIERWTALEEAFKVDPGAAAAVAWSWCLHRCLILSNVAIDSDKCAKGWGGLFRSIKAPDACAHFAADTFQAFVILVASNGVHHLLWLCHKKRLPAEEARTHQSVFVW